MSAIRLARAATGRRGILKVDGCYHGHVDSLLVKAGSGVLTLGIPGSPGVPPELAALTLTIPFNDVAALERALAEHGEEIACAHRRAGRRATWASSRRSRAGCRPCASSPRTHGVLLILDEVMTGFRVGPGGAQGSLRRRARPLTCFGKVIGGGLPVGAYGGRPT